MNSLQEKINVARNLIKAAEQELDTALRSVQVRPRAEKTTVSQIVEEALDRLRAAKESLLTLETPDDDDDDDEGEVAGEGEGRVEAETEGKNEGEGQNEAKSEGKNEGVEGPQG